MKYIVTQQASGIEEIFIFSRAIHHKDMAEAVGNLKDHSNGIWRRLERVPISAGFIEGGRCVGNSESLMLTSRPEDTALLPWREASGAVRQCGEVTISRNGYIESLERELHAYRRHHKTGECLKCLSHGWDPEKSGPCPPYPECGRAFLESDQGDSRICPPRTPK